MTEQTAAPEPSFREQVEAAETQPEVVQEAPETPVAEVEAEPTPQTHPDKFVRLEALQEARRQEKELKRQNREQQAQFAELQRQQVEMMRYLQSQQPQPQVPDKAQDPFGYTISGIEHVAGQVNNLQQEMQQQRQQQHVERQVQQFTHAVNTAEAAFHKEKPDYYEAVDWARSRKFAEYQAIGMPEEAAQHRLNQEIIQVTQAALQRGESPAQVAYRLAESMGYKPKTVTDHQKLQMQKEGQSASLPAGGSPGNGKLSLDALAKLKGDDFLKATKGGAWEKLMRNQ